MQKEKGSAMSNVVIKKRVAATLPYLSQLILKKVFEPKLMTIDEENLIETSIDAWVKKIDLTPREKGELDTIIECLLKNENGEFAKEKEFIARHNLDYRKVYRPGIPLINS